LATGLGLSTTYGIVAQSDGTISVASTVGVGTTFTIVLPAANEPAAELRVLQDPVPSRGSECILVVEDNTAVRARLVDALRGEGYEVLDAASGAQALEVVARCGTQIQFVVTDVVMPHMNGFELMTRIRRRLPNVPAVFMTGYSEKAVANYGVVAPGTELIQKPFAVGDLVAKIRRRFDRSVSLARMA
jgi:CheY-like chemotaxis protein